MRTGDPGSTCQGSLSLLPGLSELSPTPKLLEILASEWLFRGSCLFSSLFSSQIPQNPWKSTNNQWLFSDFAVLSNIGQYWWALVNTDQHWPASFTIDSHWSTLVNVHQHQHWTTLIGIVRQWSTLINIDQHWSTLMNIDPHRQHWPTLINIVQYWSILTNIDQHWS